MSAIPTQDTTRALHRLLVADVFGPFELAARATGEVLDLSAEELVLRTEARLEEGECPRLCLHPADGLNRLELVGRVVGRHGRDSFRIALGRMSASKQALLHSYGTLLSRAG